MINSNNDFTLIRIFSLLIIVISLDYNFYFKNNNIKLRGNYVKEINKLCPYELKNNIAGKEGLYFNTTNIEIKYSLIKRYFHHCGAWCLFDYRDPRKGWFWNSTFRDWEYYYDLHTICPHNEFVFAINKFLSYKLK